MTEANRTTQSFFGKNALSFLQVKEENFYIDRDTTGNWRDLSESEMKGLIEAVRAGTNWQEVVFEYTRKMDSSWLEQIVLSPSRSLFLELISISKSDIVLDLGSGWGQLTRELAARAKFVVSVEPTLDRLEINRAICEQEGISNVCFVQSSKCLELFARESFDKILLCGVYEWLAEQLTGEPKTIQERYLKEFSTLLKPKGEIIIAIENRIGLKYLLGENDDHSRVRHISYLPYEEARALYETETGKELRAFTYDITEYKTALESGGFSEIKLYAAFPDYKLPQVIIPADSPEVLRDFISRSQLPDEHDGTSGELSANSEIIQRIYRSLNNLGITQKLAPSFIIIARKPLQ